MGAGAVSDFPWEWGHVTTTALVKTGAGALHNITINGITTVGDITVYDGVDATGDIIAVLHLNTATSISVQPITLNYDLELTTGLYIAYGTAVADLTVTYK